jgi:hypothetical protein
MYIWLKLRIYDFSECEIYNFFGAEGVGRRMFFFEREITLLLRKHNVTGFAGVTGRITVSSRKELKLQFLPEQTKTKELSRLDFKDICCGSRCGLEVLQPFQNCF